MRSLILYYTYHGNTQRIAERIHAAIGGDIARIDTVAPYTGDYDDVVAQGEREVKRGYLPPPHKSNLVLRMLAQFFQMLHFPVGACGLRTQRRK